MKKIIFNKLSIILGAIFAALNLIFPGHSFILCAINPSLGFCGEAGIAALINWPTIHVLASPFQFFNILNERLFFALSALAGVIQYFALGYLIGLLIFFVKRQMKHHLTAQI